MMICQECQNKGNSYVRNVVVSTVIGAASGGIKGAVSSFATTVIAGSAHAK